MLQTTKQKVVNYGLIRTESESAASDSLSSTKLIQLEAARGIASIVVIFHHSVLAFVPALKQSLLSGGVKYTPLFALCNGEAAVLFFFVLSGFVLSYRYFLRPAPDDLVRSFLKRLPRLMLPASFTIFAGYTILTTLPRNFFEAGQLTDSLWLLNFGNAQFPSDFAPSLVSALKQCLYVFILPNNFFYNSNLWTMTDEFYGSMLVFGLCAASNFLRPGWFLMVALSIISVALVKHPNFLPFIIGCLLAYMMSQGTKLRLSGASSVMIAVLVLGCFSVANWTIELSGAVIVMLLLLGNEPVARRLSGRVGSVLGALSFPIYLVHTLVILSASSSMFLWLQAHHLPGAIVVGATIAQTVALSMVLSLPLVAVERAWVPLLNLAMKKLPIPPQLVAGLWLRNRSKRSQGSTQT